MTSAIDSTVPVAGTPTTASVRNNFSIAASEITALQTQTTGGPFLRLSGGTLTGPLLLAADPGAALGAATKQYVDAHAGTGGVASFNTRTGAVTLLLADVTGAGGAPLASPAFTGTPALPTGTTGITQTTGNSSTALATTAFVANAVGAGGGGTITGVTAGTGLTGGGTSGTVTLSLATPALPIAGGTLTGPLILAADPSTALGAATRQFVLGQGFISGNQPVTLSGDVTGGPAATAIPATVVRLQGRNIAATPPTDTQVLGWVSANNQWQPVAPTTGGGGGISTVTAGTGLAGGGSTSTVTLSLSTPVTLANGGTGAATAPAALTALGGAPLASPVFSGAPSLPTGTIGITQATADSSTALATTAFVKAQGYASGGPFVPLAGGVTMTGLLTLSGAPTANLHAATKLYVDGAPNQTITLTGDVGGSGTGSFATTINAGVVSYAKMQTVTANRLLGSGLTGTAVAEIILGTNLSFTGLTLNATGGGPSTDNVATVTATGATQTTALQLTAHFNIVATPTAGLGVRLTAPVAGDHCIVRNDGPNPLLCYPQDGHSTVINAQAADSAITIGVNSTAYFEFISAARVVTIP